MNGNANLNANNLTPQNVIEWRKKLGIESVELVYDKDNASATYNWGYTGGIQGGVIVTGKDLTKYKRLKIYYVNHDDTLINNGGVSNVCELDLSHTIGGYAVAGYANAYFSDLGVDRNFFKFKIEYKMSPTFDLHFSFAFETYQNNSLYYVYKIEGIF